MGLTVPSDVSFATANDLLVGQNVQVRRRAGSSGTSIVTDRVRLRSSRFTATVNTKLNATDFTVDNLPGLFANQLPSVNTIEVRTQSQTDFKPAGTSVASLNAGDLVSLRGPLFKRIVAGNPVLVAKKVRKR